MKVAKMTKIFIAALSLTCVSFFGSAALDVAVDGLGLSLIPSAQAQSKAPAKKRKTRKLPGMNLRMVKKFEAVNQYISPEATKKDPKPKPNYSQALKDLKSMEKTCARRCSDYEKAQVYRFFAFTYYSMENYPKAIESYKKVYSLSPQITVALELDSLNAISQLLSAQEDYNGALKYINLWFDFSKEIGTYIGSDKYFSRGTLHYAKDDKKSALKDVNLAISRTEKNGKVAKERWYEFQFALYYGRENYKAANIAAEKLLKNYPKIRWWTQYSGVQAQLGNNKKQLSSLDAVGVMGGLTKRQDVLNASALYRNIDVPYKSAKILEKGLKDKVIKRNVKNLKRLSEAWRAAQEPKKAIFVLNSAAKVAAKEDSKNAKIKRYKPKQGNIYAQLTNLYLDVDDSKSAVTAGKSALRVGKLKKPCEVHTNMGIAYVELTQFKSAISSFEKARKDKQCRAFVNSWINFAKNEQRKKKALAASM